MYPNARKNRKDIAYAKLRKGILSGEIPAKAGLSEESMAQELGISRTPVREAILMLEADGLVKIYPNKGPVVTGIGIEDIIWITQIREGLEGIAARIACDKADKGVLKRIKEELLGLGSLENDHEKQRSFKLGREIHKIMLDSTNNKRMIKIVDNMTDQLEHIMKLSTMAPKRAEITLDQHIALLDALIAGDRDEAEKHVRNHIASVTNDAIKSYHLKYF